VIALGISIFASLLMLRVLTESDGLICLLLAFVLGGAAVLAAGTDYTWLLQAVIIGFGLHLVGDIVTTEGIPPFFPLPPNIAIPIIGKVGGPVEQGTGALCGLIAFYFLVATVFLPGWDAQIKARGAATAPAPAPAITQKAVANTPPSKPASTKTTVAATQPAVAVAASSAPVSSHSIIYKIKHLP
jgi:membrane-bound metal-dependent hydrolase YbcI (DUF457 family)